MNTVANRTDGLRSNLMKQFWQMLEQAEQDVKAGTTEIGSYIKPQYNEYMTRHERRVIELLAKGKVNKEIANETGLSDATVKYHIRNVMARFCLHNRTHLALVLIGAQPLPDEAISSLAAWRRAA